jgi:hypothetical protein
MCDQTDPFVFPELPDEAAAALDQFLEDFYNSFQHRYGIQLYRILVIDEVHQLLAAPASLPPRACQPRRSPQRPNMHILLYRPAKENTR